MSRHTSVLLGEALTELRRWDPSAADQIAAHIRTADLAGVRRGMAGTGVVDVVDAQPALATGNVRRLSCVHDDRDQRDQFTRRTSLGIAPEPEPVRESVA